MAADWTTPTQAGGAFEDGEDEINAAAVAAYRTNTMTGRPLSERKPGQLAPAGKRSGRPEHFVEVPLQELTVRPVGSPQAVR